MRPKGDEMMGTSGFVCDGTCAGNEMGDCSHPIRRSDELWAIVYEHDGEYAVELYPTKEVSASVDTYNVVAREVRCSLVGIK